LYLTSGFPFRAIATATKLAKTCIARCVELCLQDALEPLEVFLPDHADNVDCAKTFENFLTVFGIVDASPAFINQPTRHQGQYYSGKYKRHYIKVKALVFPNGQCVHLSQVFRGSTHDKATFDASGLLESLTKEDEYESASIVGCLLLAA
jgi:hypothetical protein